MRYLRSVVVYIWAALVMLIYMPLLQKSLIKRHECFEEALMDIYPKVHRLATQIMFLVGAKVQVIGAEHIPAHESVVFVGNHQSFLDIPLLLATIERPIGFLAKDELSKVPLLSSWIQGLGSVFIKRGESRKALEAILEAAKILKQHEHAMVVFPEGTRSPNGKVGIYKAGSMKIAQRSSSKIVPFVIDGTYKLMPRDKKTFFPNKVSITFFEPIDSERVKEMDSNELANHCQHIAETTIGEI